MSNRRIKSIEAVANMIELTQDGEMLWKEKNPDDLPISLINPFEYVDSVFETENTMTKSCGFTGVITKLSAQNRTP